MFRLKAHPMFHCLCSGVYSIIIYLSLAMSVLTYWTSTVCVVCRCVPISIRSLYWTLSSKLDLIAGKVIARSVGLMQYSTLPLEDKISALGSFTLIFTELQNVDLKARPRVMFKYKISLKKYLNNISSRCSHIVMFHSLFS